MELSHAQQLQIAAQALRASLLVVVANVDALCDLIDAAPPVSPPTPPASTTPSGRQLRIERGTYSVIWGNARCVLGHTMAFSIIERLAMRPNEYLSTDRLLEDLWMGHRTYSTIRSTISRLKAKLRASDMADLAEVIDGRVRGHYALMLQCT